MTLLAPLAVTAILCGASCLAASAIESALDLCRPCDRWPVRRART